MTSRSNLGRLRLAALFVIMVGATTLLSQCEEATAPAPAGRISIDAGDNQYWLKGEELPTPLTVLVLTDDQSKPEEAYVKFRLIQGDGSLSSTLVKVGENARASTRLTLGPTPGVNVVEASLDNNPDKSVTFAAIGSNFYCPEKSDTLKVSYGSAGEFFHVTQESSLYKPDRGVVKLSIFGAPNGSSASPFATISTGFIIPVIWDAAFSARGDFYVMRSLLFYELLKVETDGTLTWFARLDDISEIATCPSGLLAGCDANGPFIVQCRNDIVRFAEATYSGTINNDALAVDRRRHSIDPLGEDIYFINKADSTLLRLPLDSLTVERPVEVVAQLTRDEAEFARGMDTDPSGNIYMVVSSNRTKKFLKFTPAGARTEIFDFFTLGAGNEAGMLSDLAVDNVNLFTIDTYNDNLMAFNTSSSQFVPLFADSIEQAKISTRNSLGDKQGGERTGLVILK